MSKSVLVVSRYFHPINSPRSFRTTELVKELCRQGHRVTLMTHHRPEYHDELAATYGFDIIDLGARRAPDIAINPANRLTSLVTRLARRGLLQLLEYPESEWTFRVYRALKRLDRTFDLMISIATPYPIHWGVALARSAERPLATTWVADCGDPYMGERLDSFRKFFYFEYVERYFCRKMDHLSVPIANAIPAYYPEYHDKIVVIPQGFKFSETRSLLQPYTPHAVPTFAYTGSFIPGRRDPRPILDYLLDQPQDFRFHIYTQMQGLVADHAQRSGGRVIVHDYIPRDQLIGTLSRMDFLLNIENGVPEMLPSKLIDYWLVGRPILSLDSNALDTTQLDAFLRGNYDARLQLENMERYNIERVAQKFVALHP